MNSTPKRKIINNVHQSDLKQGTCREQVGHLKRNYLPLIKLDKILARAQKGGVESPFSTLKIMVTNVRLISETVNGSLPHENTRIFLIISMNSAGALTGRIVARDVFKSASFNSLLYCILGFID